MVRAAQYLGIFYSVRSFGEFGCERTVVYCKQTNRQCKRMNARCTLHTSNPTQPRAHTSVAVVAGWSTSISSKAR